MTYQPSSERYQNMEYRRCGNSGIKLPAFSLGLWHNFGNVNNFENSRELIKTAFDNGITHFDLANNYGPPPGSAEENFGKILKQDFKCHRDEMIISSKAGYTMWDGPYGDWGSKKYLASSLDQSLKRMKLDYVDIFYHHRPDPETPLEETMAALDLIVRQGKALYVGISNYNAEQTLQAVKLLKHLGTPCLIHQPKYSMFVREPENGLLDVLGKQGVGCIPFSPLAQGLLSDKYLNGIPKDSRVATSGQFLKESHITPEILEKISLLNNISRQRGQKLAHMALSWLLRDERVTSVLIGSSKPEQIIDSIEALKNTSFTNEELQTINTILK
ncbi:L-glyceraldehyde 3-phosphate reductase [Flavobacterium aquidurense]|uniref:L-glyceraldehyde 3-phosphate reductase n=1 Tax=Flavobacterium frigidimaris TaxID=262320 RepID=A0ABX4BP57_FLAFR|nr:L-glyceraldehyde 3-phosphate reductase [Flavobacterium frigidimaris]OXA78444.1 L-glyceraldehyde 3-phosphate reductase [Flavobacterium frigidimaris]SDZ62761.1 L-glyceraldehyde 3-phosphate reductase [Flavobacterium aquidurense]